MPAYTRGVSTTTPAKNYSGSPTRTEGAATPTPLAPNSDAVCSTEPPTSASPYNPTEVEKAPALPDAGGVPSLRPFSTHSMPIYLGARNTPTSAPLTPASTRPSRLSRPSRPSRPSEAPLTQPETEAEAGPSQAYDPAALLRQLLLLLALLLGLALWLGGWQPHTSDARLGWSHGTISVVEGTDGDTGSHPLDPHDSGVLPADPGGSPVDLPKAYLGDSSRFAPGVSPWVGPVDA